MTLTVKSLGPWLTIAAIAGAAIVGAGAPSAGAAPASDVQGYVDSTARCSPPDTAAAFGSTATSRVAICASPSGTYEYRGVRVRDGARLILPATRSGSGAFVALNAGITYTVTSSSLAVSSGSEVIRTESMVDYHGPSTAAATATSSIPSSIPSAKPETPTPTTKLPPPLPAEVGGGS